MEAWINRDSGRRGRGKEEVRKVESGRRGSGGLRESGEKNVGTEVFGRSRD